MVVRLEKGDAISTLLSVSCMDNLALICGPWVLYSTKSGYPHARVPKVWEKWVYFSIRAVTAKQASSRASIDMGIKLGLLHAPSRKTISGMEGLGKSNGVPLVYVARAHIPKPALASPRQRPFRFYLVP